MRELRSPPPRKALEALLAAERSAEKGHPDDAIRQLRKALEIHPSLVEAHTNLGVQYCKAEQYEKGVEQFQLALHYGSDSAQLQTNLAYGLLGLKHFREAEQAGRRAVKLDGSYTRGHYVLGHILGIYARFAVDKSVRGVYKAEALQHLRISAEEIPGCDACPTSESFARCDEL